MDDMDLQVSSHPATLRHLVEDKLRSAIMWGRFKPGQRLVERELCELTGVGRTSIREALRQLEAEGMIQTVPNRGPVVTKVDLEEARQLYDVRALLEGYSGRIFAATAKPDEIEALDRAIAKLREGARSGEGRALMEAKSEFYQVLTSGSRNALVQKMLTMLHNRIMILRLTTMTQPGRLKESIAEICEIRDAIVAGDSKQAEAACIRHIETAKELAIGLLRAEEESGGG